MTFLGLNSVLNFSRLSDLWSRPQKWLIRVLELGWWSCKQIFPFSQCHVFSLTLAVRKQRYTRAGLVSSQLSTWIFVMAQTAKTAYGVGIHTVFSILGGSAALERLLCCSACLCEAFSPPCCSWLNPDNNRGKKWKNQPPPQKPSLDSRSRLHFQELSLWIGRRQPGWRFPTDWRGVVGQAFLVTGS